MIEVKTEFGWSELRVQPMSEIVAETALTVTALEDPGRPAFDAVMHASLGALTVRLRIDGAEVECRADFGPLGPIDPRSDLVRSLTLRRPRLA